ncbi:hypothetical protein T484DRAFT_1962142 [Baffinella frigidus]|nr:hypothetical protein T484DRAFT_1962142 [Cryptophyta sp. CCMP2293]
MSEVPRNPETRNRKHPPSNVPLSPCEVSAPQDPRPETRNQAPGTRNPQQHTQKPKPQLSPEIWLCLKRCCAVRGVRLGNNSF